MKKILLIILMLGLITGCSMNKDNEQNNVENNENKEQIEMQVGKVVGNGEFSIDVKLNDKNITLKFDLTAKIESGEIDEQYYYGIKANMKEPINNVVYDYIDDFSRVSVDTDTNLIFEKSLNEKITTKIIKDQKTNEEYAVIYIISGDKVHNVYIINDRGNLLYKYNKGEYFAVQNQSNNEKYPLLEINDNYIKVIEETHCKDFHYEVISIENKKLVIERVDFSEPFYLSGGC